MYIGIDTGGTFTDFLLFSPSAHLLSAFKVPTTPSDPTIGIISGLKSLMSSFHFSPSDISLIVHGTTIGTNAFLEDKCPPIAFLTTRGFHDIVEIGRQQRSSLYNLKFSERYPLSFSSDLIIEVDERVDSSGSIILELNPSSFSSILSSLRSSGISVVALSFLFSFLNPSNERALSSFLSSEGFLVFPSHEICPQIGEYERSVTTIINAKVSPVVSSYLLALHQRLLSLGITAPLLVMQSNTGMSDVSTIQRFGIQTLYSGLAGGVLAASESISYLPSSRIISLDIGGTSTDVSALVERPTILRSKDFNGFPILAEMVDVETIGAGGGSIASFTSGLLRVGPESQGANPGPACYSLGGDKVTLTDANLHLGYLHPDNFAGDLHIDPSKANSALHSLLDSIRSSSCPIPVSNISELALSIRRIITHNIALAIRKVTVQRGLDPREFILLGFGGAGPIHAWAVAQELSIPLVAIPPFPGVWSAFGLICSDIKHTFTRSYLQRVDTLDLDSLNVVLKSLTEYVSGILHSENVPPERQQFSYFLDLRYLGQAYTLTLPCSFPLTSSELNSVIEQFHTLHFRKYAWSDYSLPIEIVNLSIEGRGLIPRLPLLPLKRGRPNPPSESIKSERSVNFNGNWVDTPIYSKSSLLWGNEIDGPAIIDQSDSTIVVPPNVRATITKYGFILMEVRK